MTLKFSIASIESPSEEDHSVIFKGINEFAATRDLDATAGSYFFAVYNDANVMVAAISGFDNFGCMEIGGLWVDKELRGQGYGKELVAKAEEWGRSHGCTYATVFTLKDWPAFLWYQKLGFTVEFERTGHAGGSVGCYLVKILDNSQINLP